MNPDKAQIWGSHLNAAPDELMLRFCAGRDVSPLPAADHELVPFDLWTNRAHAIMLQRQGIITAGNLRAILLALAGLEADFRKGDFQLDPAAEDVHINVERYVSALAGEDAGGRLHTARSRNDQIACDMRLYLRQALLELGQGVVGLAQRLLESAGRHTETLMPGFTHHQPAMITTWGHWLCAHAQALTRDLERIALALQLVNRNPLGAAASFGTSWPIDRAFTGELMAFEQVELNTLDCISARSELEAQVAFTCVGLMNHLAVMGQDLMMLGHPYWGMLGLPDSFVTGSSIMPQKRNPDFAEVMKGKTAWVIGMSTGLMGLSKGTMSGYNRDSQWSKYAVMDILRECQPAAPLMRAVFTELKVDQAAMRTRLKEGYLAAADFADALARTLELPFRSAYDIAATAVRYAGDAGEITAEAALRAIEESGHSTRRAEEIVTELSDPSRILARRSHTGSPEPEQVKEQIRRFDAILVQRQMELDTLQRKCERAFERCANWHTESTVFG